MGIIAVVLFAACGGSSGKSASSTTTTVTANPTVSTTALTGTDASNAFSWNIAVPQVSGLESQTAQAAINASLTQGANDALASAKKDAQAAGPCEAGCAGGSTYKCVPNSHFIDARVVSLESTCTEMISGGAHPDSLPVTANFDATTGSQITLADLFTPGSEYLDTVSSAARAQLANVYQYDPTAEPDGSSAKAENFQYFLIAADGLHIIFPEYAVGPYALGIVRITVPYSALSGVVRAGGPISGR